MRFHSYEQFKTDFYFGIVRKFFAYHPKGNGRKTMYLTFDDGPEPGITEFVLDQLAHYQAKATFFCCGHNVAAHADLYNRLLLEGHAVGNHTFSHLNGLQTPASRYIDDVRQCDRLTGSPVLFRPPWGIMNFRELFALRHKKVILWDAESGDVRADYQLPQVFTDIDQHAAENGIVLFHFSKEHELRTRQLLPQILERYAGKGYTFATL